MILDVVFLVSINAENPENRKDAVRLLRAEYEAIAASMDAPEARQAAEDAFHAGPELFCSRPLNEVSARDPVWAVSTPCYLDLLSNEVGD